MTPPSALIAFALLLTSLTWRLAPTALARPATLQVLFIGNSLTEANALPAMVQALAAAAGAPPLQYEAVLRGGYGLEDHWAEGTAQRQIAGGSWRIVVLQQGPSATEGRPSLLAYASRFDTLVRRGGGTTTLYMVWPSTQRFSDFDGVSESYRMAAERVQGMLVPAGDVWRAAWRRDSTLALYSKDGFHPSMLGTYAAALTFYASLYRRSPIGLPAHLTLGNGATVDIPTAQAAIVQAAAAEVVLGH